MKDGNLIRLGATNNRLRRKQLTVLVTQAVGLLALSASPIVLHAQEAGGVARVEVTGSNVRRVDSETVGTLELFGVLSPVTVGGFYYYDDHAIRVGRVAASFAEMGLEGRHLRMYRLIAEREVALLEQLALPLLKQRNPVGREQAKATLRQASDLGGQLHAALVAEGIRDLLEGTGG